MAVEVILEDVETGQEIGRIVQAAENLPQDFIEETAVQVGDVKWLVERAFPATRAEYADTGSLRLVLRKAPPVQMAAPRELKLSMSSICDALPASGEPRAGRLLLEIKEDLWRDVELVGPGLDDVIEENFAAIRRIYQEHRAAPGFTKLHVRVEPRAPLAGAPLTITQLAATLGARHRSPLAIEEYPDCVPGGFAVPVKGGIVVYGMEDSGAVEVAGIDHRAGDASAAAKPLAALMADYQLNLVDWRSCIRIGPADGKAMLAKWLSAPPQWLWR